MKLVHLVGFITKKFVTMQHGHMNVKLVISSFTASYVAKIYDCNIGVADVKQCSFVTGSLYSKRLP